jgi:hypothetical protein
MCTNLLVLFVLVQVLLSRYYVHVYMYTYIYIYIYIYIYKDIQYTYLQTCFSFSYKNPSLSFVEILLPYIHTHMHKYIHTRECANLFLVLMQEFVALLRQGGQILHNLGLHFSTLFLLCLRHIRSKHVYVLIHSWICMYVHKRMYVCNIGSNCTKSFLLLQKYEYKYTFSV